ncbi:MAG TPA: hypothetical protein VFD00_11010 [Thermoclostridium sp.]|nr:hypothetical protein [Thermoclostridium sp.]
MKTQELFEKIQENIILDLKKDEMRCPKCKGLRFYYVEEHGKAHIETCRECHTGKLFVCPHCQKPNKSDYCNCKESRDARDKKRDDAHFEKAEKLTTEQYDGSIYAEGYGCQEGYFDSVDELIEYCEYEEIPVPDWVYCCKPITHTLDIDSAIERMLEDAFEDAGDCLVDEDKLIDFVDEWNAKQTVTSYYPDYKRVVVLSKM